jgi:hypothetical protein
LKRVVIAAPQFAGKTVRIQWSMFMKNLAAVAILLGLSACAADQYSANQSCAGTAGCASSFANTGYGPVHAQAAAPSSPSALQPQR